MSEVPTETIRACQKGDLEALGAIYRATAERVFRVALRLLGCHAEAEDATQQIFLRLHRKIATFDGRSSFSTWLYRVATNHCLNLLKGRRVLAPLAQVADDPAVLDGRPATGMAADEGEAPSVARLLECLHPDDRAAIVLKEVEGLTYRQLALVLGVPPGTVMSRLHRARQRLLAAARVHRETQAETAKRRRSGACPNQGGMSGR
ncbi:MAG: RNA polymerase sigma factor [Planctomycetota bacterium]|jgi:RNA polymerase sigma-70 factor (ECF subfamily)